MHELHPLGPAGGHCSRMQGFMQKLMMGRGGVGCPRVPTLIALLVPMAHCHTGMLPGACSVVVPLQAPAVTILLAIVPLTRHEKHEYSFTSAVLL